MNHEKAELQFRRDASNQVTIVAIMTVFNRIELTVQCLNDLFEQQGNGTHFILRVVMVDDGSTDSTQEIITRTFQDRVTVVRSSGDLFWSRGMALAESRAKSQYPDFILWLNNDIRLFSDAVLRLLQTNESFFRKAIVVGAMVSIPSGKTSYSGFSKLSSRPGHLQMVDPADEPRMVDTVNGNLVLISRDVFSTIGPIDTAFSHAYGDLDYGLRAKQAGFNVVLAAGYLGNCDRNPVQGTWEDTLLSRRQRLKLLFSRKGLPIRSHYHFVRKHSPLLWPLFLPITYLRRCLRIILTS